MGFIFRAVVGVISLGTLPFLMVFADEKEMKAGGWTTYVLLVWVVALVLFLVLWVYDKLANRRMA